MQHEGTKRCVVWIRKRVDESMHRVPSHCVVINACSVDELGVEILGKQSIR